MEVYRYLKEQFEGAHSSAAKKTPKLLGRAPNLEVVTCHGGMTQSFRSKSIKVLDGDPLACLPELRRWRH